MLSSLEARRFFVFEDAKADLLEGGGGGISRESIVKGELRKLVGLPEKEHLLWDVADETSLMID